MRKRGKGNMTKQLHSDELLIGAHTSTAQGLYHALIEGKDIGATTIQLFTRNQRRWDSKPLDDEEVALWHATLEDTGLRNIMSHGSYLVNLGAPDPEILKKSRKTLKEEIERCNALGISFLTVHPGSALKDDRTQCIERIVESLHGVEDTINEGTTRILLETTAGQGSVIGYRFEELAEIIEKVEKHIPVGVCFDTCHSFAAGYDIRTEEGWKSTLKEFDETIGLDNLRAFHVNDSWNAIGSRRDRHAPLGEGEIGIDSFKVLMRGKITREIPKYLETPGGDPLWIKEISMLREFATL